MYLVLLRGTARADRANLPEHLRLQFDDIALELSQDPHPVGGSNRVRKTRFYGKDHWLYDVPDFPYVVQYRVFEPETGGGLVLVFALTSKA